MLHGRLSPKFAQMLRDSAQRLQTSPLPPYLISEEELDNDVENVEENNEMMQYGTPNGDSPILKELEAELIADARSAIMDEEVKAASKRVHARVSAGQEKLAKQGRILKLGRELEQAAAELAAFLGDRDNLQPERRAKGKPLGEKVRRLEQELAELQEAS